MAESAQKKAPAQSADRAGKENPTTVRRDMLSVALLAMVSLNLATLGGMGFAMRKLWHRVTDMQISVEKVKAEKTEEGASLGKELAPQNLGVLYPMDSFLVNITSDQGTKYLQVQMELELSDPAVEDEVSRKKAALRDSIIVLLSSRTYKQLRDPNGLKNLRKDLLRSINQNLSMGSVKDIFFTQFHFN